MIIDDSPSGTKPFGRGDDCQISTNSSATPRQIDVSRDSMCLGSRMDSLGYQLPTHGDVKFVSDLSLKPEGVRYIPQLGVMSPDFRAY